MICWKRRKKLKTQEICSIIEACALNRVSELKFGELHIYLGPRIKPAQPQAIAEKAILDEQTENEKKYLEQSDNEAYENDLAELMIREPHAFEKLISEGNADTDGEQREPD